MSDKEANFDVEPFEETTDKPIWEAALKGDWDAVKQCLEEEPWLLGITGDRHEDNSVWHDLTLIQLAAGWCSDVDILKYLVSLGANAQEKDTDGWTPLHLAAGNNSLDVVKYLVSLWPDVSTEIDMLLHIAAHENSLDVLEYLVSLGVKVNDNTDDGNTLLLKAAMVNSVEVLQYLVSLGVNVNTKTADGVTPLHEAVRCGNQKVVEYLVSLGIDVNEKDNNGMTPLHIAAGALIFFDKEMTECLISLGGNVHAKDNRGMTPLHFAAQHRFANVKAILFLISKGADVNAKNCEGKTPLDVAVGKGKKRVLRAWMHRSSAQQSTTG